MSKEFRNVLVENKTNQLARLQIQIVSTMKVLLLLLLSNAFHKMSQKLYSRAQSQLDVEKHHRVEDNLNK